MNMAGASLESLYIHLPIYKAILLFTFNQAADTQPGCNLDWYAYRSSVLQIRRGNRDNLGIIVHILQKKKKQQKT